MIHQVKRIGTGYYSVVVTHSVKHYELIAGNEWVNVLSFDSSSPYQYVKIGVERMSPNQQYADIRIISTFDPVELNTVSCNTLLQLKIPQFTNS